MYATPLTPHTTMPLPSHNHAPSLTPHNHATPLTPHNHAPPLTPHTTMLSQSPSHSLVHSLPQMTKVVGYIVLRIADHVLKEHVT